MTQLEFITERVNHILARPDMFGPPESIELQMLLLCEMQHVCCGVDPNLTVGHWRAFIHEKHRGNRSLAGNLGLHRSSTPEFIELMREFVTRETLLDRHAECGAPDLTEVAINWP